MDDLIDGISKEARTKSKTNTIKNRSTIFNIEKTWLRQILLAAAITGCYIPSKAKTFCKFFTMYRVIIFLMLLTLVAKSASGFAYISKADYFGHSIVFGWNIYGTLTFLLSLRMNLSMFGNQERSFQFWNETVVPQMTNLGIKFDDVGFKKKQLFICLTTAVVVLIITLSCVLQITEILGGGNTAILTTPFQKTPLTCFVQSVLLLICIIEVNIPTFYITAVCCILAQCFNDFSQYLDKEMCTVGCRLPHSMQTIRQYYMSLCQAVTEFDKDFRLLLGHLFIWNITFCLFILYVLLRVDLDNYGIIGLISYIFWLLFCGGSVVIVSIFAALVHEAAHAPLSCVYYIHVHDITLEKLAQLNLFLSKLTGTQVGFSTCGLLIITKEFILTIAGVFLTYFAVLYTL